MAGPPGAGVLRVPERPAGPLRVGHLEEFTASIGLAEFRSPVTLTAFMAAPILHQGLRSGHIYVGHGEPGREFTKEDEETLVMFASQAALVIANARRHREEQRARAGLQTLIDTSPVGVVVFDMRTGAAESFNPEARRIVDGLRNPDQPPEDLLGLVTVRRADGSEVSLQEFPLAQVLSSSETVRAEEIVMAVPDGRSVTVLLNATPIRSDDGELESVVVTMQDMAAVEEQERLRAEFLGMVSHELRMPLTSIWGSVDGLAGGHGGDLDPAEMRQFVRIILDQVGSMRTLIGDLLDVARIETGALPVDPEPAEVAALVDRARNAFTSAGGRNHLAIEIEPDLPLVMADRRRIVQVIGNLLSNAARHSPEDSVIRVSAVREGGQVEVSVADRGRGIPAEDLPLLFRKFSRREDGDAGGDTGLGLAICKGIVEAHGGRIRAESDGPGLGARFAFTLPVVQEAEPARRPRRGQDGRAARGNGPGGGRRPHDAAVGAGRPLDGGLPPGGDGGPGGGAGADGGAQPPPGPAGPDAAGARRRGADGGHPVRLPHTGDLPVGLRQRRDGGQAPGEGGDGLHRQALLADGAGGEGAGGPAPVRGSPGSPAPEEPFVLGGLRIDYAERRVTVSMGSRRR